MAFNDALSPLNISGSGMSAERLRMEVVANNIANALSTRTPGGGPFRRQEVVFASVMSDQVHKGGGAPQMGGVRAVEVVDDPSEFIKVYQPDHPDADREGMVSYPNVQTPLEMTNLITASRAYEANVKVAKSYQQMLQQSLALLRG
jgi:flagellar basal-body rod protein FlgC